MLRGGEWAHADRRNVDRGWIIFGGRQDTPPGFFAHGGVRLCIAAGRTVLFAHFRELALERLAVLLQGVMLLLELVEESFELLSAAQPPEITGTPTGFDRVPKKGGGWRT